QYFSDLWALACQRVAVTGPANSGAADAENFLGCSGSGPGSDRQWFAVYDPAPGTPNESVYRAAGGQTPLVYLAWNNLVGPGPNAGETWNKSTDGLTYTNATGDEPDGTGATYSPFGGDGYPAIDQVTGKVFEVLSLYSGRNLQVVWTISNSVPALRQTFVSAASAASGWTSWTAPVQVSDGSTATGDATNVFPWIKAGGPGRADAVWYGSDKQ